MASYEARRKASRRRHEKRIAKKNKKKMAVWKKILIVLIIVILCAGTTATAYVYSKWNKVEVKEVNAEDLSINREIEHETGFLNVALFGLDSRDDDLGVGNRSDTMIVASLNKETGEVKLVSIYRDTLLELSDGSYNKANAAYSFGDAEEALGLINRNLDLDVDKYVSCTWKALVDAIDAVGGITVKVNKDEIDYLNGYQVEIIKATGIDSDRVSHGGKQKLNGTQATAYARIRYTDGGDFTRTERQREVLTKLGKKLKKCSVSELNDILNKVFPEVKTNFKLKELLSYLPKISRYEIIENMGFPKSTSFTNLADIGSCVIAEDFANDVTSVHKFLFGDASDYEASSVIKQIEENILSYKGKGAASQEYDNDYDSTYSNTTGGTTYNNNGGTTYNTNGTTGADTSGTTDDNTAGTTEGNTTGTTGGNTGGTTDSTTGTGDAPAGGGTQ